VNRLNSSDPNDLDSKLSSDPLHKKGFTDELQQKIEHAADQQSRVRHRMKPALLITAAGAAVAALIFFPWYMLQPQKELVAQSASQKQDAGVLSSPPPISSALLIGLRTDHKKKDANRLLSSIEYSTYRTMLIAPQRGELQKTAEGSGILMPYKQDFWKIDSLTHKTVQDEYHYLAAHLADKPVQEEKFRDDPNEEVHHVETLLFAGNQYLSVAETEEAWAGNAPIQNDRIWVKTLPQLTEGRSPNFASDQRDTRHVSLTDIFGDGIKGMLADILSKGRLTGSPIEVTGESWTIARTPGRWVPKVAITAVSEGFHPDAYTLDDLPKALPKKVVSHDTICCSWPDIQADWPKATDALSSPMHDMIVIFEEGKLKFFAKGQAPGADPLLTLDLLPDEQLVMAQWATDHYVQEWIDKADKYLSR
jgi:hypothetical protein